LPKPYYWHPLGKVLGGGSAINAMVHAREQAHDFDRWEKLENKRWGYNDLLPYIMKNEGKKRHRLMVLLAPASLIKLALISVNYFYKLLKS
jgi:choline dehydrogenase-like flavoprotein